VSSKTQPDSRGLVPGIHVLETGPTEAWEGVDGRVEPGHGDLRLRQSAFLQSLLPNRTAVDLLRTSTSRFWGNPWMTGTSPVTANRKIELRNYAVEGASRPAAALLATWFGVGLIPIAPGTWGSLAALPLAWVIRSLWGTISLAIAIAIVFFAGWWAAATVTKASAIKDPGAVVIDEVAGQWLVLLAAPRDPLAWVLAFSLFRIFDIWKPWPVRWADRNITGGLGVMLDDLLAAVYAALALTALLAIGGVLGVRS
jgi:phosphatidylglycerophosphatase A